MAAFLSFYMLVLKKEKIFRFNRYYLLGSIVVSFAFGIIEINRIKTVLVYELENRVSNVVPNQTVVADLQTDKTPLFLNFLCLFYVGVSLFFLFRFIKNSAYFYKLKHGASKSVYKGKEVVLVENLPALFTFLNSIYVNKNQFENNEIEKELLEHEYHHAKQKHSVDVLFVELLTVFLWFHPLMYLYKYAVQLNHEFLADDAVLKQTENVEQYQYYLLRKKPVSQENYLASHFNFLLIKNRLLMMNKNRSKQKSALFITGAALLASFLCYSFCVKEVVVFKNAYQQNKTAVHKPESEKTSERKVEYVDNEVPDAEYFKDVEIVMYNTDVNLETDFSKVKNQPWLKTLMFSKKYQDLTPEELEKYAVFFYKQSPYVKKAPNEKELEDFKNKDKYAIWIDGINVDNSELNHFKSNDFAYFDGSSILKNARTKEHPQPFHYSFYTHQYYKEQKMDKWLSNYADDSIEIYVSTKKNQ